MATKKIPTPADDGSPRAVLQVSAKRDGFRRAGREWHGTTEVALHELSDAQIEQLEAEPMLVTLRIETVRDAADT